MINVYIFAGADSPKAVKKLMSLSEPGKTRPRKAGPPQATSNQPSKRTSSVSSLQSTHSNTSLQASSNVNISKQQIVNEIQNKNAERSKPKLHSMLVPSASQSMVSAKGHERSKSDVISIKLSAESSSVTSLTAFKKGNRSNGKRKYFDMSGDIVL